MKDLIFLFSVKGYKYIGYLIYRLKFTFWKMTAIIISLYLRKSYFTTYKEIINNQSGNSRYLQPYTPCTWLLIKWTSVLSKDTFWWLSK